MIEEALDRGDPAEAEILEDMSDEEFIEEYEERL